MTVRFVTSDVAIEEGEFLLPGVNASAPAQEHYTALWVRDGGHWKLDNVRELSTETTSSSADQLASLNVFVGDWSAEVNKVAIHVSAKWDANKKFLHREITMSSGKASLVGTQTIGWDPLSGQIRSWTFNDDGSHSEGVWSMEGNVWMELATRVLPDGRSFAGHEGL